MNGIKLCGMCTDRMLQMNVKEVGIRRRSKARRHRHGTIRHLLFSLSSRYDCIEEVGQFKRTCRILLLNPVNMLWISLRACSF